MIKALLAGAMSLILALPTLPENKEPFLAVFASGDIADYTYTTDWNYPDRPDLFWRAEGWAEFPKFIARVKEQSLGRPVVIDLQAHGDYALYLFKNQVYYDYGIADDQASMGYVVNTIEAGGLNTSNLILLCEACYSGWVYEESIRYNFNSVARYMQDCDHIPAFPIIGQSGHSVNLNNLVYLEWKRGYTPTILDLRVYDDLGETQIDPPKRSEDWVYNYTTKSWEFVPCSHVQYIIEGIWQDLT